MKRKFLNLALTKIIAISVCTYAAAGEFDATELLQFNLKAEEMWGDGKYKDDQIAHVEAAQQLLANQTARFKMLDDPDKDHTVKIGWVSACGLSEEDCTDNCDLDGPELESKMKEYEMTLCKQTSFKVDEEKMRTNIMTVEEQVAEGLIKAGNILDEYWAKQVVAHYKTFLGVNVPAAQGVGGWAWDGGTTTTSIPTAQYNLSMVARLMKQMQLNQVRNAFFLENGDLFEAYTNALIESGNSEGKGDANRAEFFKNRLSFDMWNFIAAGVTEELFMVEKNAVAMKTYNRHKKMEVLGGKVNQTRYKVASRNLPGVEYDAYYEMTCKTVGGKDHIFHTWRFVTHGDIWLNPEPCPIDIGGTLYTPTGVWGFNKV